MTFSFLSPLALLPLLALPALWWAIRRLPPPPRAIRFPAMRFLLRREGPPPPSRRPPWWLLLLRLGLLACLMLGLAHPVLTPDAPSPLPADPAVPLALVVDTGWAAGQHWEAMTATAITLLEEAERQQRPVALIADGLPGDLAPAARAREAFRRLAPRPWPSPRLPLLERLRALHQAHPKPAILWLSDGLGTQTDLSAFAEGVRALGGMTVFSPAGASLPFRLEAEDGALRASRPVPGPALAMGIAGDGGFFASASFGEGARNVRVSLEGLAEPWGKASRVALEGQRHAAAAWLKTPRNPGKIVIAGTDPSASDQPLLSDTYYLHKALAPQADIAFAPRAELPLEGASVVILPDGPALAPETARALESWIRQGGALLRFAGPQLLGSLEREEDALLPVRLLPGDRRLGGDLTWEEAQRLRPPAPDSPLFRLGPPPEDVIVRAQALAAPDAELNARSWLSLADGTPLITAAPLGRGWRILVHVPSLPGGQGEAGPDGAWSNFPLSGYFEAFLRLIPEMGNAAGGTAGGALTPLRLLDGFGALHPAPAERQRQAVSPDAPFSAAAPPGIYRAGGWLVARNLGPALRDHLPLSALGIESRAYEGTSAALDLRPFLTGLALALLFLDWGLRLLPWRLPWPRKRQLAAALLFLAALPAAEARASDAEKAARPRLAYILTGDASVDAASARGLAGLSEVLARRTTFRPAPPEGVRLERDALAFYPLLYWPLLPGQTPPSPEGFAKLRHYMRGGGMILFDTRGETAGALPLTGLSGPAPDALTALASVLAGLELGPLVSLPEGHVLRKSFYLLKDVPGRYAHPMILVERENARQNDGVSPVVIGANDWASAWAAGQGEASRRQEEAWRFGVNLVMYALTGNYKTDQIHLDTILKRLGRP